MASSTSTKNEQLNPEVQDLYAGKLVGQTRVVEESLKLANFKPTRGNLVVEAIPPDEQTKGGIHLPGQAQSDKGLAWVRRVHPDDPIYEEGDLVLYRFAAGQEVTIEGRKVIILQYTDRISDILGWWPKGTFEPAEIKSS